ncbi:alkylhydroperoxidase AhpD family core domain-containing protein [Streptomyces sp. LaPpAH-199]|uniref:carboxymuconolactone decarboxylase family protein n=1 Tax=Streptomyces TaxID=1883 RepID=UPI0008811B96|nr:carboxymuconolactone decarboxylase family protein [Streptomyces sp. LaPpAH-199]MYW81876.1 carboxymuconolactone decarboxylase family protein [Streptomyces sp. SID8369]SDC18348.1 alkylhydroperoxidase AhpD family core domain-containing protein [Streptomyces sp. LaPpAH-199]
MPFPDLTPETAPPGSRRAMEAVTERLGYRPAAIARLAASPHALDGFLKISAIFESCSLDPLSREVLIMTVATRNDCHVCIAMHTAKLTSLDADPALIAALRSPGSPALPDERLDAVRRFTLEVIASAGAVDDAALRDFLAYGYSERNALDVVLGIGAYTLSTLANRLTGAPVDAQLAAHA